MYTTPDHALERADALRSLSLDPARTQPRQVGYGRRRAWLRVGLPVLLLLLLAGLGWAMLQPGAVPPAGAVVTSLKRLLDPVQARVPASGEAAAPSVFPSQAPLGEITGSGYVVAPRTATVFSKYEGRITHVAVELGDRVVAGQVLLTLENAGARFALELAMATMQAARQQLAGRTIDLAQARAALARLEPLAASGAIARQTLEDARVAVARAANGVAQAGQGVASAELAIRIAEEPVAELRVRAPTAGTVTRLDARVGNTVLARADSVRENQSLLTITDMSSLVIDADVAESHIAALQAGQGGEAVLDGFADHPFAVTVRRLAPVASAEKGTISLRLTLSGPPVGIRPNMAARIRISPNPDPAGASKR